MQPDNAYTLISHLRTALGAIELDKTSQLYRDGTAVCDYFEHPVFRIAVFAPFNYGKSTLLNALLGKRTLPIDLVPTTGAAISVRYGEEVRSQITLTNGTIIDRAGTKILQDYAILDDERRMRDDVQSVVVDCNHPFLKTGVEFLDLPGTNDREEQDNLVRDRLLSADLIVQVLDARKLMTLGERENLRDWLLDRGIKTVIFVVNFLNLLEPDEQKQVSHRMRFVAESFRSELPPGTSNLYRVDALPALRARLKGDTAAAQTTGLAAFESALQTLVQQQKEQTEIRLPRVLAIAEQIQHALTSKIDAIAQELQEQKQKHQNRAEIQRKAEKLLQQGFQRSSSEFQSWLYLSNLLSQHESELATALQQGTFETWETEFKKAVTSHTQALGEWVKKGCEFFAHKHPGELCLSYPNAPHIELPPQPSPTVKKSDDDLPVAIAAGLGFMVGGPVGAVVAGGTGYILNKITGEKEPIASSSPSNSPLTNCTDAAKTYLTRFSEDAFSQLQQYETLAQKTLCFQASEYSPETTPAYHQHQFLNTLLQDLNEAITQTTI
ncbi:dynamin family protein [Lusitaniella coriacea]|uniref:dynamin family protein n=1 Tax=Lusitaniella coriacea TaxID=1983105 RepID=UPI003CECACE9